jgi:hypothetical protein
MLKPALDNLCRMDAGIILHKCTARLIANSDLLFENIEI